MNPHIRVLKQKKWDTLNIKDKFSIWNVCRRFPDRKYLKNIQIDIQALEEYETTLPSLTLGDLSKLYYPAYIIKIIEKIRNTSQEEWDILPIHEQTYYYIMNCDFPEFNILEHIQYNLEKFKELKSIREECHRKYVEYRECKLLCSKKEFELMSQTEWDNLRDFTKRTYIINIPNIENMHLQINTKQVMENYRKVYSASEL